MSLSYSGDGSGRASLGRLVDLPNAVHLSGPPLLRGQYGWNWGSYRFAAREPHHASNSVRRYRGRFLYVQSRARRCLGDRRGSGSMRKISNRAGHFTAYGHELTISSLGIQTDSTVYFLPMRPFGRTCWDGAVGWTGFRSRWWTMNRSSIWPHTIAIPSK